MDVGRGGVAAGRGHAGSGTRFAAAGARLRVGNVFSPLLSVLELDHQLVDGAQLDPWTT